MDYQLNSSNEIITLNVGGKIFQTYPSTLLKAPYFQALFDKYDFEPKETLFIDRNSDAFSYILDYLREDSYQIPYRYRFEAGYFGLDLISEGYRYKPSLDSTEFNGALLSLLSVGEEKIKKYLESFRSIVNFQSTVVKLSIDLGKKEVSLPTYYTDPILEVIIEFEEKLKGNINFEMLGNIKTIYTLEMLSILTNNKKVSKRLRENNSVSLIFSPPMYPLYFLPYTLRGEDKIKNCYCKKLIMDKEDTKNVNKPVLLEKWKELKIELKREGNEFKSLSVDLNTFTNKFYYSLKNGNQSLKINSLKLYTQEHIIRDISHDSMMYSMDKKNISFEDEFQYFDSLENPVDFNRLIKIYFTIDTSSKNDTLTLHLIVNDFEMNNQG